MATLLFVVLFALQCCDVHSTKYLIDRALAHEANPVMAWLIKQLGTTAGLIVPKAVVLTLAYIFLLPFPWVLALVCVMYTAVVANNFALVRKH